MKILALDPADTCGVAYHDGAMERAVCEIWSLVVTSEEHRGARLSRLLAAILKWHKEKPFDVLAYEDASIGSHNPDTQATHNRKAGIIEYAAYRLGARAICYTPSSVKKYATGNGRAEKPQMIAAARTQLRYGGSSSDEADALWVLAMATHLKGLPMPKAPKKPRRKVKDSDLLRLFK